MQNIRVRVFAVVVLWGCVYTFLEEADIVTELEKKLRAHPMVAARLKHARDTFAAEAAVRECIHGDPVEIESWRRSSTYKQIKLAFSQLTTK
jgi:hypothetical protein